MAGNFPAVPVRPTQPVRDVTLHLTADNKRVDVKLVDRGGELHVAVRSADPDLTTDLRASVHDLVGDLTKGGFRTETWQPGDASRHRLDATAGALPNGSGDPQQTATSDDPRRQGRNAYDPESPPPRRSRELNSEWLSFINALTSAERNQ